MGKKKDVVDQEVEQGVEPKPVKEKVPTKAELAQKEADEFAGAYPNGDEVFYGNGPFPVLSRAAAVLLGFTRYNSGVPCKEGHDSPRKVKTSACLACARLKLRDRHKRRLKDDPEYKAKFSEKAKTRRLSRKEAKAAPSDGGTPPAEA